MSWADYIKFKKTGKAIKVYWVKDFWDSIDLSKEQYDLMKKVEIRLFLILAPSLILLGVIIYHIILLIY